MSFTVEFEYEIEKLGMTMNVFAEFKAGEKAVSGLHPDENTTGSAATLENLLVVDENGQDYDIAELLEIYVVKRNHMIVWPREGGVNCLSVATGKPYILPKFALPRRIGASLKPLIDCDKHGREYVRQLVSVRDDIEEIANTKASDFTE